MPMSSLPLPVVQALQQARNELAQRQFAAAATTLDSVLAQAPECLPALGMAGATAQMLGKYARAADFFRKGLAIQPHAAGLYAGLGMALFEDGDAAGAVAAFRRACELDPAKAPGWYNLGKALKLDVQTDAAIAALERALKLAPTHVLARLTLADAYASVGDIERAAVELRHLLAAHPDNAHAWFALANLKVVPFTRAEVAVLQHGLDAASSGTEDRALFAFALARALEDHGDIEGSFRILQRANCLQRARVDWNAAEHTAYVTAIERAFATPLPSAAGPGLGNEVILIASLPRSGSTLVEQILASHPEVEGANEIKDLPNLLDEESRRRNRAYPGWVRDAVPADWQRLGQEYLARTTRWRQRKPRFTDKNLAIWQHVGAALAMLPAARVVIVRRDPLETCLACYRQWFASGTGFSYDLDEMADYCADFTRLTRFWLDRFPGRVWNLEYEQLVAAPEATIRRLLDFCGLAFDPVCLAFYATKRTVISAASAAQVRQPLHDTARAARYGRLLDGLRERLRDAGLM